MGSGEEFLIAAPTLYRPNSDMPFAWLVVTSHRILLCNTHRSRGIYAEHSLREINELRIESRSVLRILLNDAVHSDLVVPLPPDLPDIDSFFSLIATKRPPSKHR
jgi:hypothetical protein